MNSHTNLQRWKVTTLDIASILGMVICLIVVIYGILVGQSGFSVLLNFYDLSSILITFGGALCCVMIMAPDMKTYFNYLKSISLVFKKIPSNEEKTIRTIIELSNVARKEGLLALEETANNVDDEFLKKGVLLIVDGTDPELVRNIMETELSAIEERHSKVTGFWDSLASMGPAWGMIGTLIGLVNMLKKMSDPNSIGDGMAVALITTFYGSVLANWICIPVSSKLKANSGQEIRIKEVMVEGLLSIQAGENPRVIEEKLKSFLSPAQRLSLHEEGGEEVG